MIIHIITHTMIIIMLIMLIIMPIFSGRCSLSASPEMKEVGCRETTRRLVSRQSQYKQRCTKQYPDVHETSCELGMRAVGGPPRGYARSSARTGVHSLSSEKPSSSESSASSPARESRKSTSSWHRQWAARSDCRVSSSLGLTLQSA